MRNIKYKSELVRMSLNPNKSGRWSLVRFGQNFQEKGLDIIFKTLSFTFFSHSVRKAFSRLVVRAKYYQYFIIPIHKKRLWSFEKNFKLYMLKEYYKAAIWNFSEQGSLKRPYWG